MLKESPPYPQPPSVPSQQAAREGNFRREQKQDDQAEGLLVAGAADQEGQPVPQPRTAHGLLPSREYYHCNHWGEPCDLLIFLQTKIDSIMQLAHAHPLGSQLRPQNTLDKIWDQFH